jgi:hypothetical protein
MKEIQNRVALGLALSLGVVGMAQAVTTAGSSAAAATTRPEAGETLTNGTVSSINTAQGLLAVSGRVYRFTPGQLVYSDDRRKPVPGGLEGLKAGTKVTVRSVTRGGSLQAIQVVARD